MFDVNIFYYFPRPGRAGGKSPSKKPPEGG